MNKTETSAKTPAAAEALTIRAAFERYAERGYFAVPGQEPLKYSEFALKAAELGERLRRDKKLEPGDRVGLWLANGPELAMMYFACYFYGWVAVPIHLQLHPDEVKFIFGHAGTKVTCHHFAGAAAAIGSDQPIWTAGPADTAKTRMLPDASQRRENDPFVLMFTSGSASRPKAVVHSAAGLAANAVRFNALMGVRSSARFFHVMPMTYMAGFLNTLLCPLMAGASVVSAGAFDASLMLRFWDEAIRSEADTFWLSPTMLVSLTRIDRNPDAPGYCRRVQPAIFVGTAPLQPAMKHGFEEKYGAEVLESYGLSELLLITAARKGSSEAGCAGSIPAGIQVRAAGDGEIWVNTPDRMLGYLDPDSGSIADPAEDGWFPTGDVGRVQDNKVFITGRKKDLIIKGGFNISPRAVEEVIALHPSVERVCVLGIPHDLYGERIAAVVLLKAEGGCSGVEPELRSWCRERAAVHAQPDFFVQVADFPLGISGKIQKKELLDRLKRDHTALFG